MLLSTARHALNAEACVLEEVFFPQALILPDGEARVVQVVLEPGEGGASRFRLLSAPAVEVEDAEWSLHATGSLSALRATAEAEPFVPDEVRARCPEESSGGVFYPGFREVGYTLGPAFQWIGPIWRREGEALCQMETPPLRESTDPYELYPGLVDSCFQLLCSCRSFSAEEITRGDSLFIPFSIGAFRYYGKPSGRLWCHARLPEQNDETLNGELRLYDEDGRLVAEVTGFTARRIQREAIQRATEARLPDWLYEIAWRPRPLPTGSTRIEGTWLLLADWGGMAEGLAASLRAAGARAVLAYPGEEYSRAADGTVTLDPTTPEGFRQLVEETFGDGGRGGIVDLWALDAPQPEAGGDALLQARDRGPVAALHLLQGLVSLGEKRSGVPLPRLWLVSRNAQAEGAGEVRAEQTSVWGLGRVLGMEHPELWGGLVDLDAETTPADLLAHLASMDGENQVLLHGSQRLTARLARGKLPIPEAVSLPAEATYLLTGGLGGLGVLVARWLVERGARHLALMERSGRSATHAALAEMEAAGAKVVVLRGDVTREADVERVLAEIASTLPPLRGVIHAAGVLDDGVLLRQDRARVHAAMAPKDEGAWHLHAHTQGLPLDFFVLFSSASSFIGSPGQGNYAAGNAYLDGLAHQRRAAGLPALGINWGGWAEVGMAADRDLETRLASQGLGTIPPDTGLRFLEALLGAAMRGEGPAQAAVLPFHWPRLVREVPPGMEPPLLVEILREVRPHAAAPAPSSRDHEELLARLQEAPLPERRDLLLAQIRARATAVLGLDASQAPDPRQPLNELGLDSLMAIELRNALGAAAGRTLPAMLLFDHPTLDALTDFLAREVFAEVLAPPATANGVGNPEDHWDEVATQLEALPDDDMAALMLAKLAALEEGDQE
jgi:acyl carrier protein